MAKGKGKEAGMIRYSTFLRPDQIDRLREVYAEQGVRPAEQIRRAIDAALGTKKKGGK